MLGPSSVNAKVSLLMIAPGSGFLGWRFLGISRNSSDRGVSRFPSGVRLQVNCPCDNLNNCPGLQEGIRKYCARRDLLPPAGVAQSVEHLICNQRVGGSIPFASSRNNFPETVEVDAATRARQRSSKTGF